MSYQERLEPILQEIEEKDPLRLSLYLVVILVFVWLSLILADENQALRFRHNTLAGEIADLKSVGEESSWRERVLNEQVILEALRSQLWVADTESQKVAAMQSSIKKFVDEAGLLRPSIKVGRPVWENEEIGLKRVRARIRSTFHGNAALQMISLIESNKPIFIIENINIEVNQHRYRARGNKLLLDVVGFFEVPP